MDVNSYLTLKANTFVKAHQSLQYSLKAHLRISKLLADSSDDDLEPFCRSADIQSFEICVDSFWKWMKACLTITHGIPDVAASPKAIFQHALALEIISQEENQLFITMIDERNFTSHKYDEETSLAVHAKIEFYGKIMHETFFRIHSLTSVQ